MPDLLPAAPPCPWWLFFMLLNILVLALKVIPPSESESESVSELDDGGAVLAPLRVPLPLAPLAPAEGKVALAGTGRH